MLGARLSKRLEYVWEIIEADAEHHVGSLDNSLDLPTRLWGRATELTTKSVTVLNMSWRPLGHTVISLCSIPIRFTREKPLILGIKLTQHQNFSSHFTDQFIQTRMKSGVCNKRIVDRNLPCRRILVNSQALSFTTGFLSPVTISHLVGQMPH